MGWHKSALLSHVQTQTDALCHLNDVAELFDYCNIAESLLEKQDDMNQEDEFQCLATRLSLSGYSSPRLRTFPLFLPLCTLYAPKHLKTVCPYMNKPLASC